jgi:hypothetical protein
MVTKHQKQAAKENVGEAQEKWHSMSKRQRSKAHPEGLRRAKPGEKGGGDYYRIVVRDKDQFTSFRYHDVGREGHAQRLTGRRKSGSWDTQAWLISKKDAHRENGRLVADTVKAEEILDNLGSEPKHVKGDIFEAKPRRNIPEKEKPTPAQQRA